MSDVELIREAIKAKENAVAPFSEFAVGAALLTEEGKVYPGCNIENSAFSPTICAERTAFASAIAAGERNFTAIAVVSDEESPCYPCGVCRQFMADFCDDNFKIIAAGNENEYEAVTLGELLPRAFRLKK